MWIMQKHSLEVWNLDVYTDRQGGRQRFQRYLGGIERSEVLMGDDVEPWREFIESHGLEIQHFAVSRWSVVFYIKAVIFNTVPGQDQQSCCHGFWVARRDGRQSRTVARVHREAHVAGCKRRFMPLIDEALRLERAWAI